MSYMTTEAMQEQADNLELLEFEAQAGIMESERFVSENDMERAECIHENGEWSEHFPFCGPKFAPYATFECFDCGEEFEVK